MESRALTRLAIGVTATAVLGLAMVAWWRWARPEGPGALAAGPAVFAPEGQRVRVEVLNASRARGRARRATFALREAGFDVVRYDSDPVARDSTLILDRSGHPEWARRVARALGVGRVESRADSTRFLDVTVLLGADWRPPSQPFHP
jgi:hypothetical protein